MPEAVFCSGKRSMPTLGYHPLLNRPFGNFYDIRLDGYDCLYSFFKGKLSGRMNIYKDILKTDAGRCLKTCKMCIRDRDNSQQKKEAFSQIRTLTGKIAEKTLEQLEREGVFVFPEIIKDAEDITQDQMILQSVNDTYRTSNVMGFLGCGDERLIIESRFSGDGEDFFFQDLLDRVLDFPNIVDIEADANHNNRLFNFLLFLFPHYLKAAMRKGLFKKMCIRDRSVCIGMRFQS